MREGNLVYLISPSKKIYFHKKILQRKTKVAKILTGKEIRNLEKIVRNGGGGETSVSFSTLSTLGTDSLLFSVEIILMPYDEIIGQINMYF